MEVQQENYLHSLVEEMVRWREIIGYKYAAYKLGRLY
jgi:hypothetical protein